MCLCVMCCGGTLSVKPVLTVYLINCIRSISVKITENSDGALLYIYIYLGSTS